jgi:hypothetical protein
MGTCQFAGWFDPGYFAVWLNQIEQALNGSTAVVIQFNFG